MRQNQETIKKRYKIFEKSAEYTQNRLYFELVWSVLRRFLVFGIMYLVYVFLKYNSVTPVDILLCIICLCVVTAIVLMIALAINWYSIHSLSKAERTFGYDINTINACDRIGNAASKSITKATIYNYIGNPDLALIELQNIDPQLYTDSPNSAQTYYAAKLTAFVLKNDLESATITRNQGMYYLNTYINSPIFGATVSLSLGMFEYLNKNYQISIDLLNNCYGNLVNTFKPKNKLPYENYCVKIFYYLALNYYAMGDNTNAARCLENCNDKYSTQFYKYKVECLSNQLKLISE